MTRGPHFDDMNLLIDSFLAEGGLVPADVKQMEEGRQGSRNVMAQFTYEHRYSCVLRLYEVPDDEGRLLPYFQAEVALGRVAPHATASAYQMLLEWSREVPSGIKSCLTDDGLCCLALRQRVDMVHLPYLRTLIKQLLELGEEVGKHLEEHGLLGAVLLANEAAAGSGLN